MIIYKLYYIKHKKSIYRSSFLHLYRKEFHFLVENDKNQAGSLFSKTIEKIFIFCYSLNILFYKGLEWVVYFMEYIGENFSGNIAEIVAANLQNVRKARKMTLQELSDISGVSKSMLGEIERGSSNPTINVLWKIVTGLKIPISELIHIPRPEYRLVHENEWKSLNKGPYIMSLIFEYDSARSFEVYHLTFKPHSRHESRSHQKGVVEYTMVYEGELTIFVNNEASVLKRGDSFMFDAENIHSYSNNGDEEAKAYSIIYYPQQIGEPNI